MTNYKLIIRYDGTGYRGWEHQPGEDKTIQGKLETAVIRMLNPSGVGTGDSLGSFEGEIPDIISAGRTDGGVSAEGMCANVKLDTSLSCIQIRDSLNRNLPDDICVISVEKAGDRFHARYNATGKTYRYTCYAGELKPVFERKYVYELGSMPDIVAILNFKPVFVGEYVFALGCMTPLAAMT